MGKEEIKIDFSKLTPKDFRRFPGDSIMQNFESEQVAVNIMIILGRTGNTFRPITLEEYTAERKKDGEYTKREELYFEDVKHYCLSAENAIEFCNHWKNAAISKGKIV